MRQQTSTAAAPTRRRMRRKLTSFFNMPLDVVYEVLSHVQPLDLLCLARTSKPLRTVLMSRSSLHAWIAARQNVEALPPCPEDMSEPAYADLMFCYYCQHCLKPKKATVFVACRLRLCVLCMQASSYLATFDETARTLGKLLPQLDLEPSVADFHVSSVLPTFSVRGEKKRGSRALYVVYIPDSEYRALETALSTLNKADWERFINNRLTHMKAVEEHASLYRVWCNTLERAREERLVNLKDERRTRIVAKLEEIDMAYVLSGMTEREERIFWGMKGMRVARKLTESDWNMIAPAVLAHLDPIKLRIEKQRAEIDMERSKILHQAMLAIDFGVPYRPTEMDIVIRCGAVREIMSSPFEHDVTLDDFLDIEDTIQDSISTWWQGICNAFRRLVAAHLHIPAEMGPLWLAVGQFFICAECGRILGFPAVTWHFCPPSGSLLPGSEDGGPDDVEDERVNAKTIQEGVITPQDEGSSAGYKSSADILVDIVRAYGLDPTTATAQEMHEAPARLLCMPCVLKDSTIWFVYNWFGALSHAEKHDYNKDNLCWVQVSQEMVAAVKLSEESLRPNRTQKYIEEHRNATEWRCAHCPKPASPMTQQDLTEHLTTVHIGDAAVNMTYDMRMIDPGPIAVPGCCF